MYKEKSDSDVSTLFLRFQDLENSCNRISKAKKHETCDIYAFDFLVVLVRVIRQILKRAFKIEKNVTRHFDSIYNFLRSLHCLARSLHKV